MPENTDARSASVLAPIVLVVMVGAFSLLVEGCRAL
jgi:hypothetical protein